MANFEVECNTGDVSTLSHDCCTQVCLCLPPQRRSVPKTSHFVAIIIFLIVLNVGVLALSFKTIFTKKEDGGCEDGVKVKEVVAPLCVPCEEGWVEDEAEEMEEAGGWRRYRKGAQEFCCPLRYNSLASAVDQIYRTVLDEKQQELHDSPPMSYSYFKTFYGDPQDTEETVLFSNHNKPAAHMTGVEPYNATQCFIRDENSSLDNSLQTVCDWPLRFEPYRSTTRGYVERLTWGLVVPVSGLYRVHSTVNFYFSYPGSLKKITNRTNKQPIAVVHQLTRYDVAAGSSSVLIQRNQTVSSGHTDGLTSFLVTLEKLNVGDVISISVSHRSAMAMRDRWHSEGLFLVQ